MKGFMFDIKIAVYNGVEGCRFPAKTPGTVWQNWSNNNPVRYRL